jgi:hypothetical protein
MKRALVAVLGLGAVLVLGGFSLFASTFQTARVSWTATQTTSVVSGSLGPKFGGSTDVGGAVSYGPAAWRIGGIACSKTGYCFTSDSGIYDLIINVKHEDGGIDCVCDSTDICGAAVSSGSCHCALGVTELAGSVWTMALDPSSTVTAGNPDGGAAATVATLFCRVDLLR